MSKALKKKQNISKKLQNELKFSKISATKPNLIDLITSKTTDKPTTIKSDRSFAQNFSDKSLYDPTSPMTCSDNPRSLKIKEDKKNLTPIKSKYNIEGFDDYLVTNLMSPNNNIESVDEYSNLRNQTTPTNFKNKVKSNKTLSIQSWEEDENTEVSINPNSSFVSKSHKASDDFKAKYKTEICKFWELTGNCRFHDKCAFAHGFEDIKTRNKNMNYKTKKCKQFYELGFCLYGKRCQFLHSAKKYSEDNNNNISYKSMLRDYFNKTNQNAKCKRLRIFHSIIDSSSEDNNSII